MDTEDNEPQNPVRRLFLSIIEELANRRGISPSALCREIGLAKNFYSKRAALRGPIRTSLPVGTLITIRQSLKGHPAGVTSSPGGLRFSNLK